MTNTPDPAKASPLRRGDRPATTLREIADRDEQQRAVPAGNVIPRLPASSPWSDPKNWGPIEPPLGEENQC